MRRAGPVADVQHNAIEREDALNELRKIPDEAGGILVEHHLLAESVEPLDLFAALLGLMRLAPRPLRQLPGDHAAGQKRDHRHPRLHADKRNV